MSWHPLVGVSAPTSGCLSGCQTPTSGCLTPASGCQTPATLLYYILEVKIWLDQGHILGSWPGYPGIREKRGRDDEEAPDPSPCHLSFACCLCVCACASLFCIFLPSRVSRYRAVPPLLPPKIVRIILAPIPSTFCGCVWYFRTEFSSVKTDTSPFSSQSLPPPLRFAYR